MKIRFSQLIQKANTIATNNNLSSNKMIYREMSLRLLKYQPLNSYQI